MTLLLRNSCNCRTSSSSVCEHFVGSHPEGVIHDSATKLLLFFDIRKFFVLFFFILSKKVVLRWHLLPKVSFLKGNYRPPPAFLRHAS